jgi:release factor glutamine methyltransferase
MAAASETLARAEPGSARALTIGQVRRELAAQLRAARLDTPELDARILVGHALGLEHATLAAASARTVTAREAEAIGALARRRLAREPVARILGRKEFWSLTLQVDGATLVPRPETETVVETALAAIDADGPRRRPLRIADLGTGTGALILALLAELPQAWGVGTDISYGALRVARENAKTLGCARAVFLACDMVAALGGPFDLIMSNPPYIASHELAALAPEVRDFDPRAALDGGPDGLDGYRRIARSAPALLAPGGILVVELGAGQAPAVTAMFTAAGLAPAPPRTDVNGVPRAFFARKAEKA